MPGRKTPDPSLLIPWMLPLYPIFYFPKSATNRSSQSLVALFYLVPDFVEVEKFFICLCLTSPIRCVSENTDKLDSRSSEEKREEAGR